MKKEFMDISAILCFWTFAAACSEAPAVPAQHPDPRRETAVLVQSLQVEHRNRPFLVHVRIGERGTLESCVVEDVTDDVESKLCDSLHAWSFSEAERGTEFDLRFGPSSLR